MLSVSLSSSLSQHSSHAGTTASRQARADKHVQGTPRTGPGGLPLALRLSEGQAVLAAMKLCDGSIAPLPFTRNAIEVAVHLDVGAVVQEVRGFSAGRHVTAVRATVTGKPLGRHSARGAILPDK